MLYRNRGFAVFIEVTILIAYTLYGTVYTKYGLTGLRMTHIDILLSYEQLKQLWLNSLAVCAEVTAMRSRLVAWC